MTDRRLRRSSGGTPPLSPDQRAVFDAYFGNSEVVCTPAGSGTGKTTTAVETVAEAVVRQLDADPERNPFESVLVTTFTKDAARQLRAAVKDRLREHRRVAPADDPVVRNWGQVLRWLETASNVRTIDSFTQDLLREVALDVGVAPSFGVADGIRRSDLLEEVFSTLRSDPDLAGPIDRLEDVFPSDGDGRDDWEGMVADLHRRCREFCLPVREARGELLRSVTDMHAGREPDGFEDVLAIADELTDYDPGYVADTVDDPDAWVDHARETHAASRRLAGDFGVVLGAFDEHYDRLSRSRGALTHTDITALVRAFLEGEAEARAPDPGAAHRRRERFRESLTGRFDHVIVDEFQDVNFAQCRILAHLIGDARALLIGDLKQSIYEWRSAEPRLFSEVIDFAAGEAAENVLDADAVRSVSLTENFRSHPHLVRVANHVFPQVFSDPGRGGIGSFDVEYEPLSAERVETEPDRAHVHALDLDEPGRDEGQSRREAAVEAEAERVASTLEAAFEGGTLRVDRARHTGDDADDADLDAVRPGDVAILFRTKRYVSLYSRMLDRYGIDNAVIGGRSLFREPEVGALIDALAWIGRPDDRGAVRRLAESPVAGLSEEGIRRLAAHGHDVDRAIAEWDGPAADRRELRELATLREDLRYRRDGSKAELVSDLLIHSAFDVTALAGGDGLQRFANLRRCVEVVAGWEEEERLPYGEFMRRLERLHTGRIEDDTTQAAVADVDSPETVKLLTAHAAKGLEFPVVVLGDTTHDERYRRVCDEPFLADRRHGMALRPTTGTSEQPDGADFPNFEGDWFHDDDADFDFDRGLLWVSERRGSDGRIRHDHPLKPVVEDRRAEFWRLLYVALTRAGDHLVVPFADPRRDGEWTTWAAALGEYLDPGDGVLETEEGPVPVGVDDLATAEAPADTGLELADLLTSGAADPDPVDSADAPGRRFRPATLSATDVDSLLGAPPAFQRSVLRGAGDGDPGFDEPPVVDVGGARDPPEAGAPEGVRPAEWGTAVHAALAAVHDADDPAAALSDPPLADALDSVAGGVRGRVRERIRASVLPAYRETDTWHAAREASVLFPEFPVLAPLTTDESVLAIRGRVDLLYRRDGWHLVDFKTGRVDPESERFGAYRSQLDGYAWLLDAAYGVDVESARLLSLPEGVERPVGVDPGRFEERLSGVGALYVDEEGVLRGRATDR
jgi:ATP-dependent helicase/nuclease subunit A